MQCTKIPLSIQGAREEGYYLPSTEKLALVSDTARGRKKRHSAFVIFHPVSNSSQDDLTDISMNYKIKHYLADTHLLEIAPNITVRSPPITDYSNVNICTLNGLNQLIEKKAYNLMNI